MKTVQGDLFGGGDDVKGDDRESELIKGMVRRHPHHTEVEAAWAIRRFCKTRLQHDIITAFLEYGAMTDGELENLPQFVHYSYSTVRKRRTELYQMGLVRWTGEYRFNTAGQKMKVWDIAK